MGVVSALVKVSARMRNAVETGTVVPIHRHPTKDESFVILRGKVRVTTHNDDGSIIEDVVLRQESGNYGVDISKNVWNKMEALEAGGVRRVRTSLSARRIFWDRGSCGRHRPARRMPTTQDGDAYTSAYF